MTIDIANRLVELRKKHGLSQEQLAEKLGLSRQAVSKWERAEASPDTDNLIMLSRLYEVSLDELLNSDAENEEFIKDEDAQEDQETKPKNSVRIGKGGIFVEDKNGDKVHIGWDGIHVNDRHGTKVDVGADGVFVDDGKVVINGVEYSKQELREKYRWAKVAYFIVIAAAFCLIGALTNMWLQAGILLLTIPLFNSLIMAIVFRNAHVFAFPVLVAIIYLVMGFFFNLWHPGWIVFLTIPLYYTLLPRNKKSIEDCVDSYD